MTTVESPKQFLGVERGNAPRPERFVYVEDVDSTLDALRSGGVTVLREAEDMVWGERVAWVADPEGNPVALSM